MQLNDDERDAVDALVEYRLRLADKPFLKPLSLTPELKALSDGVLDRERALLLVLAENVEEELLDILAEKEQTYLALSRHKEMCTLLEGGLSRAATLRDSLLDMKKERDRRRSVLLNSHTASARAMELQNQINNTSSAGNYTAGGRRSPRTAGLNNSNAHVQHQQQSTPGSANSSPSQQQQQQQMHYLQQQAASLSTTNVTARSLEDIERQVQIESALSANLERTMTVLYPTYLDFIGRIQMMKRRCELEKDWSVTTAQELEVVESKMKTLKQGDSYRKQQLAAAKQQLDDANRAMFMSRKELTLTHHRILGLEKLKNGAVIDAQSSLDLVNRIRRELQQSSNGESETFQRLMDTECAELCDLASVSTMPPAKRTAAGAASSSSAAAVAAGPSANMGAAPFHLSTGASNPGRLTRR